MTALADILRRRIATTGPITFAQYMAECLMHPAHGYYATRTVFGQKGDFITAPEISQMFGELIGLTLAQAWQDQGAPKNTILVELGAGRGTMMADILRAGAGVAGFSKLAVHIIEQSQQLRDLQCQTIGRPITHHSNIQNLPEDAPVFMIANEFFDALPIHQFQRAGQGWRECVIACPEGQLGFGWSDAASVPMLQHFEMGAQDGDIVEYCPSAASITAHISGLIAQNGGAGLIIDYGDWQSKGDTFQAVRGHAPEHPLANPGMADLTAHVDFEWIFAHTAPAVASRLAPQGVFLERLGITARAQQLAQNLSGAALDSHIAAHRRLTHPDKMGVLFKVMGLAPRADLLPAGLEGI